MVRPAKTCKIIADIVVGGHLHLLVFLELEGVKELSQMQAVDGKTVHLPVRETPYRLPLHSDLPSYRLPQCQGGAALSIWGNSSPSTPYTVNAKDRACMGQLPV